MSPPVRRRHDHRRPGHESWRSRSRSRHAEVVALAFICSHNHHVVSAFAARGSRVAGRRRTCSSPAPHRARRLTPPAARHPAVPTSSKSMPFSSPACLEIAQVPGWGELPPASPLAHPRGRRSPRSRSRRSIVAHARPRERLRSDQPPDPVAFCGSSSNERTACRTHPGARRHAAVRKTSCKPSFDGPAYEPDTRVHPSDVPPASKVR